MLFTWIVTPGLINLVTSAQSGLPESNTPYSAFLMTSVCGFSGSAGSGRVETVDFTPVTCTFGALGERALPFLNTTNAEPLIG